MRFQEATLVRLHWQLRCRGDGRVLRCGVFETAEGPTLMAGYETGWLWYLQLEHHGESAASAIIAARWRRSVLGTGGYDNIY
jgi:hypothetical protein